MNEKKISIEELEDVSAEELAAEVEDFDLSTNECEYEIWIVGDDKDNCATDFEVMLDDGYTDGAEAKKCYDYLSIPENLKARLETLQIIIPEEVKHIYLRLEAVIPEGPDMMSCNEIMYECEVKL